MGFNGDDRKACRGSRERGPWVIPTVFPHLLEDRSIPMAVALVVVTGNRHYGTPRHISVLLKEEVLSRLASPCCDHREFYWPISANLRGQTAFIWELFVGVVIQQINNTY
ncbi:hypothetical protein HN011_007921 [Eciton burchellii]|nr:hypothetical protein HN011_007921 [Eciton burchellii]